MSIAITRSINVQTANGNYLSFGSANYDTPAGQPFSFVIRARPIALSGFIVPITNGWYGVGGFYFQLYPDNNHLNLVVNTTQALQANNFNPVIGTDFTLIVTKDASGNWHVYKDGVELTYDFNTMTDTSTRGSNPLTLGDPHGDACDFEFCDFQWYDYVLSPAKIANLSTATPNEPSAVVSWWLLQESAGTSLLDQKGVANGAIVGTTTGCYSTDHPDVTYTTRTFTAPDETSSTYVRRSQLFSKSIVTLSVNRGTVLSDPVDITPYLRNNQTIQEGLTNKSSNVGGIIFPLLMLELDNSRGMFDELDGLHFRGGYINNSLITISTQYYSSQAQGAFDSGFGIEFDAAAALEPVGNPYIFTGLIKTASSSWDNNPSNLAFNAGVLPVANILATETANAGYVSAGSFAQVIVQIMAQPTIARYISTSSVNVALGYDAAGVVDSPADLFGMTAKDALDQMAFLSGSIYWVDSDNVFHVEPISNGGYSVWDIAPNDIMELTSLEYDPLQFTEITWDSGVIGKLAVTVNMSYLDRQANQYDFNQLALSYKFVLDDASRLAIIQSMLLQYQYQHRRIVLVTKSNPDVRVNNIITISLPQQFAVRGFTWGGSSWGDGSAWSAGVPGLTISSSTLWRVIEVTRDILNESMTLTAIQAGQAPDGGL